MPRSGWGIRPLTGTRIPKSQFVLAARSALSGSAGAGYRESWRCAALAHTRSWPEQGQQLFFADPTPERLWREVTRLAGAGRANLLWTYNLTSALRVTDALRWLPALGWELGAFSLNPGAPWMSWRRGDHSLKMMDVASLWGNGLDQVATLFGTARREIHPEEGSDMAWIAAARQDRIILSTAVDAYVGKIREGDLGNLAVTGNGQAWSAFRRRFLDHGILVHDDEELHVMERAAMWTGRCEAYWHGSIDVVNVAEWDFSKAHTRLCKELSLPTYPQEEVAPGGDISRWLADDRYAVLAEVEVSTTEPLVPTRFGDHMAWPVGRFTTTLWSPELRLLQSAGAIVRVVRGHVYRTAPVLRDWATWILEQLDLPDDQVPAWWKEILRKWGNVLVGRFAMRYPKWDEVGQPTTADAFCMPYINVDTGEESMLMQVGRTMWLQQGTETPHDHAPAITGYIMSAMRAKLWGVMSQLPAQTLLYVDTDSMLVADRDNGLIELVSQTPDGIGLRLKRSWSGMAIYGPRQVVTGTAVRIAGLPKSARRTGRHEWQGEVTESLTAALAGRSPDAVRSTPKGWIVTGTDVRRQGHGVGWTTPFVVGLGPEVDSPLPTPGLALEGAPEEVKPAA